MKKLEETWIYALSCNIYASKFSQNSVTCLGNLYTMNNWKDQILLLLLLLKKDVIPTISRYFYLQCFDV